MFVVCFSEFALLQLVLVPQPAFGQAFQPGRKRPSPSGRTMLSTTRKQAGAGEGLCEIQD